MSIQDSINLFNGKINQTLWTRQNISPTGKILQTIPNPVVLPIENYYKVLEKQFKSEGNNIGTSPAFGTINYAEYFSNNRTNEVIAIVNSVKYSGSTPTKIAVATYYDQDGDIAILNRFDQTGRPHDNYFHVYSPASPAEIAFYQNYLADRIYTDGQGVTHHQAFVPHIHFNTRSQTLAFGHHDTANAISIASLTRYLSDLMADYNPSSLINNLNMGMPFLDFKNARMDFVPTMESSLASVINFFDENFHISPDKFSDYQRETLDMMKSLINIDSDDSSGAETNNPDGPDDSHGGPTAPPNSPTPSGPSRPRGGSGGAANRYPTQPTLSEQDLRFITNTFPNLDELDTVNLTEVKRYISWVLRQATKEAKQENQRDYHYIDNLELNPERIRHYRAYLKYVKGLLNLKLISKDVELYQNLHEILSERDPELLSTFSHELLKSLTTKTKKDAGFAKGGKIDEPTQPQR